MRVNDPSKFFNYLRMTTRQFDLLLEKVGPKISKHFHTREPISPAERLSLTLRYLASGDSMTSISYAFRIGVTTVSCIINECCEEIWSVLKDEILQIPDEETWLKIAGGFNKNWQLPNCLGAIDGKHIVIQAPPNSGSEFYNYKNSHSIVLMAICDSQYRFVLVDVGARGRQSDGGIFRNSNIGKKLFTQELHFPHHMPIEYGGENMPFYIVGDEAFPLSSNLMRPYPGGFLPQYKRIYNYRLSRGRRVIENCFGILASRWRIFRKPIIASLNTSEKIIKAAICLHNFLMEDDRQYYCPNNYIDQEDNEGNVIHGLWRHEGEVCNLLPVHRMGTNNRARNAAEIRDQLASYFMTEGAVSFQWYK